MAPRKKELPPLGPTFLQAWRVSSAVKQEDAGQAAQLVPSMVSKIENGKVPYSQYHIEAWAKLYGCRPADLLGTDPASVKSPEAVLRSALLAFGVDKDDLGRAIKVIKGFADDLDEQSELDRLRDQSEFASPRRAREPSR